MLVLVVSSSLIQRLSMWTENVPQRKKSKRNIKNCNFIRSKNVCVEINQVKKRFTFISFCVCMLGFLRVVGELGALWKTFERKRHLHNNLLLTRQTTWWAVGYEHDSVCGQPVNYEEKWWVRGVCWVSKEHHAITAEYVTRSGRCMYLDILSY